MFDKLIECEPEGTQFKNRRSYFMVSSLVVGVLFATAVVISIYAAETGLGNSDFELTEMLAPVEIAPAQPEPPRPRPPGAAFQRDVPLPARQAIIARMDEAPIVPAAISVVPNTQLARPRGEYIVSLKDSDPVSPGTSGRETPTSESAGTGLSQTLSAVESSREPVPPPPVKPPRIPPVRSIGIVNGRAKWLPKPVYPAAAVSLRIEGKVDVQVSIDETGRVTSANTISGHPLLRTSAEQAARNARFTPTYLSNMPVKVTGVIVYNFTR